MPKVSRSHKEAQRQKILEATLDCFQRLGYRGTSIADISAEAGVSAGTIYNYFSGKQQVVREVALGLLNDASEQYTSSGAEHAPTPAAVISTILSGFVPTSLDPLLVQLNGEATVDPELADIMREIFVRVRSTLAEALAAWARANRSRIGMEPEEWGERVAPLLASIAPGFLLQRAIFDDFDTDAFLASLPLILPAE